ncbi:hypothetical protein BDW75DRAFT_210005 [Aspergillus navahoensis]
MNGVSPSEALHCSSAPCFGISGPTPLLFAIRLRRRGRAVFFVLQFTPYPWTRSRARLPAWSRNSGFLHFIYLILHTSRSHYRRWE